MCSLPLTTISGFRNCIIGNLFVIYSLSVTNDWILFVYFRILNKLTPEKFDKLSLELLNVGIETNTILHGIILLVSYKGQVICLNIST